MMRRFCAIMLSVVLYLAWGTSDVALHHSSTRSATFDTAISTCDTASSCASRSAYNTADATSYADLAELMWHSICTYGYDMLRTNISNYYTGSKTQQNLSSRNNLRHRTHSEKIMAEAVHSRRTGHITKIFEYNPFTSSLRVVYYLHTLCRLRI